MASSLSPRPAHPGEWSEAFALLFQQVEHDQQPQRIEHALQLIQQGEVNPEGLFVIRDQQHIVAALLTVVVPGGTALLWPPQVSAENRQEHEDSLLQHVLGWLREQGVKLTQALLHPDDLALGQSLLRNGFSHISSLCNLRHNLQLPSRWLGSSRLGYQTFAEVERSVFQEVLLRTYEDSLDCPEVNGVRSIEEVILGHQAQGRHDPRTWLLASAGAQPVGVVITTELPETGDWELSYLGIVPEARRQGFGREMVLHVLLEARAVGVSYVSLSVDERNEPAYQLYRGLGFDLFDRREIFLSIRPTPPNAPGR